MKESSSEIHQAFGDLTKEQLTRLRKMADYPIKSTLNKASLVEALTENFRKDPVKLLMQLPLYDLEYLSELCRIGREDCLSMEEFPDLLYIQEFNICEWDYCEDGYTQEMWLTDDMYYSIAPFIDQIVRDVKESGRCLMDFFFWGMVWLYGFFPAVECINVLKKKLGKREEDRWPVYGQLVKYFPFNDYYNRDGFIVHPAIGEYEYMLGERRSRGFDMKPLRDYTFDEIVRIGATGPYFSYGEEGAAYKKAAAALKKCGMDDKAAMARLSHIWIDVQDIDGYVRPTDIFRRAIGGEPALDSLKDLESVTDAVFSYMNGIPRWCLGGRTPEEVPVPKEHREQLAAFTAAMDRVTDIMNNAPRVGRNDPCPCGSGLKYKNCHGKSIS